MNKKPARPEYPSDRAEKILLRLPEGMRERIAVAAERRGRSMNSELIHTLEEHYPKAPSPEWFLFEISDLLRDIDAEGLTDSHRIDLRDNLEKIRNIFAIESEERRKRRLLSKTTSIINLSAGKTKEALNFLKNIPGVKTSISIDITAPEFEEYQDRLSFIENLDVRLMIETPPNDAKTAEIVEKYCIEELMDNS